MRTFAALIKTSMFIGGATFLGVALAAGQGSGLVTLEGQLVDSACALESSSAHQLIEMDVTAMGQLIRQGASVPHPFSLRLVKCSLSRSDPSRPGNYLPDWQHVRVTFEGRVDSASALFSTEGTSEGIALRIADSQGRTSTSGVPMPLAPLTGEDQELRYTLQLVGNGRPMAVGSHRTAVRFRLEYF